MSNGGVRAGQLQGSGSIRRAKDCRVRASGPRAARYRGGWETGTTLSLVTPKQCLAKGQDAGGTARQRGVWLWSWRT